MNYFLIKIPTQILWKAFTLESEEETGGNLIVSIKRESNKVLYTVNGMEERVLDRSPSSATLNTGAPHIWHTHPKGFGARLSETDVRSLISMWGLQAISLYGTPPLFLVFSAVSVSDDVVLYNAERKLAARRAEKYLEFKAYVAVPSAQFIELTALGRRWVDWRKVDGDECLLFQDGHDLKPVSPELILSIVREHSLMFPGSVISLLSLIRGVCSRGLSPDYVDFMRILSLRNTLARLGTAPKYFIIVKDNHVSYRVALKDPVYPEILEPDIRVVEG